MAYQKQNFVDGKPLSAAELNRMEEGIAAAMEAGGGNVPGGGNVDLTGYAKETWVQENYQPKGDYPLRGELPSVPVQSVNGKTGAVKLTADDVSARPSAWMPTAADVGALPNTYKPPNQTAQQVGADPAGTAANAVSGHNSASDAHADIRLQLTAINDRLQAFFDSDDQTLDELSEIVAYITSNKSLIDAITTSKVSVLDIVNDLVTNVPAKPLSAAQGVVLKGLIDNLSTGKLDAAKLTEAINTALAQAKASGEFNGKDGDDYVLTDADKDEIVETVKSSMEGIPDYWQTALDEGMDAINTAIETAGRNKSAFLFYTDAHWGYGSGRSPALLKYLGKHTAINKTIFGGDFGNTYEYPDTGKTEDDWMNVMRTWRLAVRDIPNHHSVVGNHDKDVDAISTDKGLYGFLFTPEESNDIVRGGDFFYYIDDVNEKTRYFYLNTGLCNFSDEQCAFLIEGLTSVPPGWHIVVASHIWFVYDDTSTPTVGSTPTNIQKVLNLLDAYNLRATGSMTIDSESHSYDFSACNGWVEFCIGGHTHVDYNFTSTNGIPVILCQTDSYHCRGSYSFAEGTTTEASVSGIVADYDAKKISVVRVGRGESREIQMTNYVVNYTNLLDDIGYEVDQEYSTSSGTQRASSNGYDLSGWIELTAGETYYLKNFVMPDNVTGRDNQIYRFRADKTYYGTCNLTTGSTNGGKGWLPVFGEDGNLSQFTVPSGLTGEWIRINCTQIDETSILTRNQPIE